VVKFPRSGEVCYGVVRDGLVRLKLLLQRLQSVEVIDVRAGLRMLRYVGGDKCLVESKCRKRMSEANVGTTEH